MFPLPGGTDATVGAYAHREYLEETETAMAQDQARHNKDEGKHRKKVTCSICSGTGKIPYTNDSKTLYRTCTTCHGTGQI